jgi:hypothetical protein
MKKEEQEKCPKGLFGYHKWLTEKRLSGAGKIFVYKLDPPICEYCGMKKVSVV